MLNPRRRTGKEEEEENLLFYARVTRRDAVRMAHRCSVFWCRGKPTIYGRDLNVKIPQVHGDGETAESAAGADREGEVEEGGGEEPPRIRLPPRQKPPCGEEIRPADKWLQVPPHWRRMKITPEYKYSHMMRIK